MTRIGLTTAQLTRMRAVAADLLPDSCTVQSVAETNDGAGGWTEVWSDVATVVCRLDPISARSRTEVEAAKEARSTMYRLTVPWDTVVTVEDRVVHETVVYQVAEVHPRRSWEVVLRATIVRFD